MNYLYMCLAAFITGIAASMGLGGGMILILYLTFFCYISQIEAQGINLIFFIPIAILSVILHSKNKLIDWKSIYPIIVTGCIGACAGAIISQHISSGLLRKIFAVFLLIIGINQLFIKDKNQS